MSLRPSSSHREVFGWIPSLLGRRDLLKGRAVAVDSTTLEAHGATRSIVGRGGGQRLDGFLVGLARASGIVVPTR